jgi:DNA-binding beta-propeller fold protein YncE
VTSDNSLLYVSNFGSNSVTVFSILDSTVLGTVQTGAGPDALALNEDENFLLVADSNAGDVAVIRTTKLPTGSKKSAERALVTMIAVGAQPSQMAVKVVGTK